MKEAIIQSLLGNVNEDHIGQVALKLRNELTQAVAKESTLSMLANHHIEPLGLEQGDYVVVDVGGSTLRVSIVLLNTSSNGRTGFEVLINQAWAVRDSCKKMDKGFFQWVGQKLNEVLGKPEAKRLLEARFDKGIDLGLSWSFPLDQTHYNRGRILHVGKGFEVGSDVEGEDLNELLTGIMKEDHNIIINVDCIINDSLAVYAASGFLHPSTVLGCVLGTGLNICVPLKTALYPESKSMGQGHHYSLFNSEASLFGSSFIEPYVSQVLDPHIDDRFGRIGELTFELFMDRDVDGRIFQPLELLTSGRYLQELTRLAIVQLHSQGQLLTNIEDMTNLEDPSQRYEGFPGALVCFINENDDIEVIREQLVQVFGWEKTSISVSDVTTIKEIVDSIIKRGAFVVAVVVVAFVGLLYDNDNLGGSQVLTMGYVGLVLHHYNKYRLLILKHVNDNVTHYGVSVKFEYIENSTLIGTAVSAAYFKNIKK